MRALILILLPLAVLGKAIDGKGKPEHPRGKTQEKNSLIVGAFNIQVFGQSKMSKPEVVTELVKIIQRYDVLLIQEIRDAEEIAIVWLFNNVTQASGGAYSMTLSERLGRTSSKEQYSFFYRHDLVSVEAEVQTADPSDIFEREPYIAVFNAPGFSVGRFAYLANHVKPDDAVAENDAMWDTFHDYKDHSSINTEDWILGGDFNADCSYVGAGDWADIRLRTDTYFNWVIGDDVDTTLSASSCAYDRFVLTGGVSANYVGGSAVPFNYWTEYNLSEELAKDISDHYPIDMSLD